MDRAEDPFCIFKSLTGKMGGYLNMRRGLFFKGFHLDRLKEAFPETAEFSLKTIEAEWREARQRMLNFNFDS